MHQWNCDFSSSFTFLHNEKVNASSNCVALKIPRWISKEFFLYNGKTFQDRIYTFLQTVQQYILHVSLQVSWASFWTDGLETKEDCGLRLQRNLPMEFLIPQFLQCTEMSFVIRSTTISETDESKLSLQPLQYSNELSSL